MANNRMEAMLKMAVRDRKNAMVHRTFVGAKTLAGASIADVITSWCGKFLTTALHYDEISRSCSSTSCGAS